MTRPDPARTSAGTSDAGRGTSGDRRRGGSLIARAWRATLIYRPVMILLILLVVVLSIAYPDFRTANNVQNLLSTSSLLWTISIGMTFALISGGADLSVGAVAALAGIFLAKLISAGLPAGLAILLVVLGGAALSAGTNGVLIGVVGLSFFVVTLATMTTFTGVVNLWSGGNSLYVQSTFITSLATRSFLGIQLPVYIMAVTFLLALWLQRLTYFGRDVYATGGNIVAARLSGIRAARTNVIIYAITGLTAAAGGVLGTSRIGVAVPIVDNTLPLLAIAAVVLGGTSLLGGAGGVTGTALGVLFIGTLQNGLSIAGLASFWQQVVTGIILVVAVVGDRFVRRLKRRQAIEPQVPASAPESTADTSTDLAST